MNDQLRSLSMKNEEACMKNNNVNEWIENTLLTEYYGVISLDRNSWSLRN